MPVWAANWGCDTAIGVSALLRSPDPSVTITDSGQSLGTLAPGESASASDFQFHVADTCSNGHVIPFQLVCRDASDSIWTSDFSIRVGNCVMGYDSTLVNDPPPGGNGNGRLDPGETAQVSFRLRNGGFGHAYNLQGTLHSYNGRLQMIDSVGNWPLIRYDSVGDNSAHPFIVHLQAGVVPGTCILCSLRLLADHYSVALPIVLTVGKVEEKDPIHDNEIPPRYWAIDDVDSAYSGRPTYHWIEARGIGQELDLADDQTSPVPLPAQFGPLRFYGQRCTTVAVCSNGWLAPGTTTCVSPDNAPLPASNLTAPAICANWDDLNPWAGGVIWAYYDTAGHAFVVEWDSVAYKDSLSGEDKFEIVMYDSTLAAADGNSVILVQYMTANGYRSSTIGIQDQTLTYGINCLYDSLYNPGTAPIAPGRAIKYTTDAPSLAVISSQRSAVSSKRPWLQAETPFRRAGRVRFSLPEATPVRLAVYDVNGREVNVLAEPRRFFAPGAYTATWNGRDRAGRATAQGVYVYRLETSLGTFSCKVVKLN
jgi:hypothetical protein